MTKKHKGFMLVELLIVSVFILSVLIFLYVQLINVNNNYRRSFTYNTVPGLYIAKNLANYLIETNYVEVVNDINNGYLDITNSYTNSTPLYNDIKEFSNVKKIIITKEDLSDIKTYLKNTNVNTLKNTFSNDFREFILKQSSDSNELDRYRLIIEYKDNTFATIVLTKATK